MINLLSESSKDKLIVDVRANNYVPMVNRNVSTVRNATHYGIGFNYHLYIQRQNRELVLACSPLIVANYFRTISNEVAFLAFQFELKTPIVTISDNSRALYAGLGYTTTPLVYTKGESKFDFFRFFLSFGL